MQEDLDAGIIEYSDPKYMAPAAVGSRLAQGVTASPAQRARG